MIKMHNKQEAQDSVASEPILAPTEAQVRAADLESQESEAAAQSGEEREEAIRRAAYEAYRRRDGGPGGEMEDWLEAERSVDATSRR